MQPLRLFMKEQFQVELKVWHHIPLENQHSSVNNIIPFVESLDPWVLNSLFQMCVACKSTALALSLILKDGSGLMLPCDQKMSVEDAVAVARVDE